MNTKPKNPAAVAMGRIRSPAKAAASRANLEGRRYVPPRKPRCPACAGKPRRCETCRSTIYCRDCNTAITPGDMCASPNGYGSREVVCEACAALNYPHLRTFAKG